MAERLYEDENEVSRPDPDGDPIVRRKLIALPYDIDLSSLIERIEESTLYLRPISQRPDFQRQYVWTDSLASRLIESLLLNVPIPPCYFSQNADYEFDVIDGQQRIYSIYRFLRNEFELLNLEVMSELNGCKFKDLSRRLQRQIETHTLRAIVVTHDSDPEIQFDVFERLNTNTMPMNAQELRNCIYRGKLNDLLGELALYKPWLEILGKQRPDKRLRDEELILRFFAFYVKKAKNYQTPQKKWLNSVAEDGQKYSERKIKKLENAWKKAVDNCLIIYSPDECFRRKNKNGRRSVINRALMDLLMISLADKDEEEVEQNSKRFRTLYENVLENEEFQDLIGRSIDHKKRTLRRFEIWNHELINRVF